MRWLTAVGALLPVTVFALLSGCVGTEHSRAAALLPDSPGLFDGWDDQALPEAGRAYIRFGETEFHFDELNTCGRVEHGRSFMFRGTGRDEAGRPVSLRIYRRMGEDRRALAVEEDSVQLSVRGADHVWAHSLMRLRRDSASAAVRAVSGQADDWPAIAVRDDGLAAVAAGTMTRQTGATDIVADGPFEAAVHCHPDG